MEHSNNKIAILSDIHANLEAFTVVLEKLQELEITQYVCLGDIVGYNANPKECLDLVRGLNCLGIVKGNHDEYVGTDQELLGFNPQAAFAVEWTRQQLTPEDRQWLASLDYEMEIKRLGTGMRPFRIVHGTLDNPKMWGYIFNRLHAIASMEYQRRNPVCFCGHTHMPIYFVQDENGVSSNFFEEDKPVEIQPNTKYLFNVGSIGQPRDNDSRAAFAVYDPDASTVQLYRLEYDIKTTQEKILASGLPSRLAERLPLGR